VSGKSAAHAPLTCSDRGPHAVAVAVDVSQTPVSAAIHVKCQRGVFLELRSRSRDYSTAPKQKSLLAYLPPLRTAVDHIVKRRNSLFAGTRERHQAVSDVTSIGRLHIPSRTWPTWSCAKQMTGSDWIRH